MGSILQFIRFGSDPWQDDDCFCEGWTDYPCPCCGQVKGCGHGF